MLTNDQIASQLEAIAEKLRGTESTTQSKLVRNVEFPPERSKANADVLQCSFCGAQARKVAKLIAGPGVYICSKCVTLCAEILLDEGVSLHLPFACASEKADTPTFVIRKAATPASETAQAAER